MSRFIPKSILIDLSGTIHIENTLINGTQLALERLVWLSYVLDGEIFEVITCYKLYKALNECHNT